MKKNSAVIRKRAYTRRLALQAIYQWQINKMPLDELQKQFAEDADFERADAEYFDRLLNACLDTEREEILRLVENAIDRPLAQIDAVESSVLQISVYEIYFVDDVDRAVAIAEAVRLAKKFGGDGSYKFVNKVLDQIKTDD